MSIISIFRRPWTSLIFLALVGSLVAAVFAARQPVRYQTSISFAVNRIDKAPSTTYQYDGYYAIQAADLFSQTVVSWFSTPSVLVEVYERAGVSTAPTSLRNLTSRFKTKKYAAQNIVVTFGEETEERARLIAEAVTATMQTRAAKLNQTAEAQALFEIVGSKPVIVATKPSIVTFAVAGFLVGFLVGLTLLSLTAYLRNLPTETGYAHRD